MVGDQWLRSVAYCGVDAVVVCLFLSAKAVGVADWSEGDWVAVAKVARGFANAPYPPYVVTVSLLWCFLARLQLQELQVDVTLDVLGF